MTKQKSPQTEAPARASKLDGIVALLERDQGASLDEIVAATGWQPHSARAVLTGLRKKSRTITREKVEGVSRYRIVTGDDQ